jgi:acetoacetyl-CoA synthetase
MHRVSQISSQLDVLSPAMTTSNMAAFAESVNQTGDYEKLHKWSIEHTDEFWTRCWHYLGIVGKLSSDNVVNEKAELNLAENLLKQGKDEEVAMVTSVEGTEEDKWTWKRLKKRVSEICALLQSIGIKKGDRVGGILGNTGDTVAAMLGVLAIGAIWSSVSMDFGVQVLCV